MAETKNHDFLVFYHICNIILKKWLTAAIWPSNVKQYYLEMCATNFWVFLIFLKILLFSSKMTKMANILEKTTKFLKILKIYKHFFKCYWIFKIDKASFSHGMKNSIHLTACLVLQYSTKTTKFSKML